MKKFIKSAVIVMFVLIISGCSKEGIENPEVQNANLTHQTNNDSSRTKFPVDATISIYGCDVHIQGTLDMDINILTGEGTVNGFEGTVTVSGEGCPNVTLNFSNRRQGRGESLIAVFDKNTCKGISKVTWSGSAEVARLLNDESVNRIIVNEVRNNCR